MTLSVLFQVLNTVIEKDYKTASDEERECAKNLRVERLKLMKEEVEKDGGTVNLDASKFCYFELSPL